MPVNDSSPNLRVAVVHEWWAEFGGSEKVTNEILEIFPDAVLFALTNLSGRKFTPSGHKINTSFLDYLPIKRSKILTAMCAPIAFRTLTLKHFDLVISSSHTFSHTARMPRSKKTLYISYVHTPPRVLWASDLDKRGGFLMNKFALQVARRIDRKLGNHVDFLSSNSYEIQSRILRSWGRQSDVIWPPVSIPALTSIRDSEVAPNFPFQVGEYLLSAGRFVDYKNHEFCLQIAESTQIPIVFMGGGTPSKSLTKAISNSSVEVVVLKGVTNYEWKAILKNARCLLFPVHEDFGMTPVESIALGTPVIALGKGGALDYIQDGVNGFCIDDLDIDKWSTIVKRGDYDTFDKVEMLNSVQKFSVEAFRIKFSRWVLKSLETHTG